MITWRLTLVTFLLLLLATGCSQQPLRYGHGKQSSLQDWVNTELAPYVSQQLGQHPRFKGEPVIIVRLDGDDIQPNIDALTRSIRDRLMERWQDTHDAYDTVDARHAYYLSLEFLMGRALSNAALNLGLDEVTELAVRCLGM